MTSILLWGGVSYYPASGERLREPTAPGSHSPQTTIEEHEGINHSKMKYSKATSNK